MSDQRDNNSTNRTDEVDHARVESLSKPHKYGPQVGRGFVTHRQTNKKVPVSVRAIKNGAESEYSIVDPKDREIGKATFKKYSEQDLRQAESSGKFHSNHERLHYGQGNQNKYKPKVYVDSMKTYGNEYKGVGKLMHQLAAEKSFRTGGDGRVQLTVGSLGGMNENREAPATSAGFHESFGFRGQDVYNPDGTLHHDGQDMHKKLAEETWDEAQTNKKIGGDYWPPEGGVQKSPATFTSKDRPEMYLPDDVIDRERSRMETDPILDANEATTDALIDKDRELSRSGVDDSEDSDITDEPADDWEAQKARAKESAQKSLGKNRKSIEPDQSSKNPLGQKPGGESPGQKPGIGNKLGSGTGGAMGKSPSGGAGGASKMPGAGGAGGGAGKMGGGAGGKGGGLSVDPDEVKRLAEQAASGDIKGAVKGGIKVGEKALLEKGYMAAIDALIPTFGISFLAMEAIVLIGKILGVKITWWMRWLVHAVNLLIIILILIFCIIVFAAVVGACKASGLDGSGWIATFASGPVGWAVDLYRGDSMGSSFIAVCKEIGFISK